MSSSVDGIRKGMSGKYENVDNSLSLIIKFEVCACCKTCYTNIEEAENLLSKSSIVLCVLLPLGVAAYSGSK